MMYENQSDGCLSCQNNSIGNPSTCWKRKGTGSAQRQGHTQTGSAQTRLTQTHQALAAQCDVPPPRMNVSTRLSYVFDTLGDDEDKENDDDFTDDSADWQDADLIGMHLFPQHMN
jgi:hypothetical protein